MTAFITKYALTQGILKVEGEVSDKVPTMLFYNENLTGNSFACYAHGSDWHRTFEEAVVQAERMRTKKLGSLAKEVERIQGKTFTAYK